MSEPDILGDALDDPIGEVDVVTAEPQIVTHHVGDVTCILMVPAGCPIPHVTLNVHAHGTTADQRRVAVEALGLGWRPVSERRGIRWRQCESDAYRATVFLHPDDPDAQVPA
jgi:hypothetical protein